MGNSKQKETMNNTKAKMFAGIAVCAAGVKIQEWDPIGDIEDFIGDTPTVEEWGEGFEESNAKFWNSTGEDLEQLFEDFVDWHFFYLKDDYEFDPIGKLERDFKNAYEAETLRSGWKSSGKSGKNLMQDLKNTGRNNLKEILKHSCISIFGTWIWSESHRLQNFEQNFYAQNPSENPKSPYL